MAIINILVMCQTWKVLSHDGSALDILGVESESIVVVGSL
jgi:hypothetical protein